MLGQPGAGSSPRRKALTKARSYQDTTFDKPELRKLWQMASDHGLAVQIHMEPRYAPGFEPLIKEFKETRVIIDHLGRPFQ
ncbi:amidohydrolase family protein [Opitutia bacterium ISCC 51]|nr:amidohydrolase family protein [Opitutae bacterium ISCC 51]QXD30365.1 amidohydrolase family protein [Opitutae bacterium ISCC 52]